MKFRALLLVTLSATILAACAPQTARVAAITPPREKPVWAFETSDVPVEEGYRFGRLDNGMRYVIRSNATPKGTALVRMEVSAGSLDESEAERGFAHYVEHMAFNGSTRVPEGEMVKLLEREGLAFGADTNAQTSFDATTYMLDLPRNDPALLDTALMLMRETASELSFNSEAVDRERGVVLSEMRDRNSFALRNFEDQIAFAYPGARYAERLPIGTAATLNGATAEALKAFWRREYVPAQTTLVVVGDFDVATVEEKIRARFVDWRAAPAEPQPDAGPVVPALKGQTDVFIDPALSERITAARHGPWLDEPDTTAQRRENLLRQVGYGIINRRLQRATRQANPPFRNAGIGSGNVFEAGRTTTLAVDTVDGKWKRGLTEAALEYRRALAFGFTEVEVAEQIANVRTAQANAAASASTRSNGALFGAVLALIRDEIVPGSPQSSLERLEAFIPQITPDAVLAALKREVVPLEDPLLRFQGRREPEGGAKAIREAWNAAARQRLARSDMAATTGFAYTDFGPPGQVVSDVVEPALGIRQVRFANGVRLNLKRTDLEKERIGVQLSIDGGDMLANPVNPLATEMLPVLTAGGLGKHSQDDLQSLLAGRTVGVALSSTPETFVAMANTTPRDLELQLQLMAAYVTDPGYRAEGETLFRNSINNFFAQYRATPGSALGVELGGVLSDNDPRFSLQKIEDYRALSFAKLKADLADRLGKGAIEIGLVGDLDEAQAIALVAKTLGALPPREDDFRPYAELRSRPFTAGGKLHVIRHTGAADQAIVHLTWPTRDGEDPVAEIALELLQRIAQIEITESLREQLGKAYSPGASSDTSRVWRGYGAFGLTASVDTGQVPAARAAILQTIARLRDAPVSADEMLRARAPMIEGYENALKNNRGWITLVDRAQTEPDRIERFLNGRKRLEALTPADIQALARKYLTDAAMVPVLVLPEGVPVPEG